MKKLIHNAFFWVFQFCGFILISLTVGAQNLSQNAVFNNLTPENGLPTTSVTDITQDSFGFIWLGTWDGVYRFDGKNYERFFYSGRYVEADQAGGVWVSMEDGDIGYFDPETEEISLFQNVDENLRYLGIRVLEKSDVLVGTSLGIKRFDPISKTFKLEEGQNEGRIREMNVGNDGRLNFHLNIKGKLFLGTRSPEGKYSYEDFPLDKNSPDTKLFYQSFPTIVFPYGDTGTIILNPNGFAKRKNPKEEWEFFKVSQPDLLIEKGFENDNSYELQDHFIWLNQINSISRINLETAEMETIDSDVNNSRGLLPLESESGCNLFIDRQGVLWATRFSYGLSLLNIYQSDFGLLRDENGKVIADILSAYEMKDGSFWVGARTSLEKGLIHFSKDGKTILKRIGAGDSRPPGGKTISKDLTHPYAWEIFAASDGTLWVGTGSPGPNSGGLNRISPNSDQIIRYKNDPSDPNSLSSDWIFNIMEDRQGKLWISHSSGIDVFDPDTEQFSLIDPESKYERLRGNFIDPNGKLVGVLRDSVESLFTIDTKTKQIQIHELFSEKIIPYFAANPVVDNQNRVWIALTDGLGYTDLTYEKFIHWVDFKETEFPDIEVRAFSYDDEGNIYLATSDGILQYFPESGNFRKFGYERGLQSLRFDRLNHRGASGKIYFAGTSGANIFHPDQIKTNPYSPQILFKKIRLDGENYQSFLDSVERKPNHLLSSLLIPPGITTLSIEFAAIHFGGNGQNPSQYRLLGFNETWQDAGTNGTLTYTNLPAGDYVLEVKSMNLDGVWNEEPFTLNIKVLPPWYQTWWAYTLYFALFILLAYLFIQEQRKRAARIEREKSKDRELAQAKEIEKAYSELKSTQAQLIQSEKMASLGELTAGIAHEIQNPLNFVNNFSEVSEELVDEMNEELDKGDIEEAKFIGKDLKENLSKINHHGKRADAIVKSMLEHSRTNKGEKVLTDLNALVDEFVRLSYHGLRAKDKSFSSDFKLHLDPDLPKVDVVASDIGRVILNLVNNAFYAVNEKVKTDPDRDDDYNPMVIVSSKKTEKGIKISIQDNGSGIPEHIKEKIFQPFFTTKPTGSGTGLGLSLSYDIVKAHGGELTVESKEGKGLTLEESGTEFRLILPLA
ncbi:ATP-binding protein [Algoriphagus namhaensis]|uniref:histidine kinase n=1 Tax=Algoriphagus namhaensis TaxID=915353 RepID=A0ABV8AS75_9BACT